MAQGTLEQIYRRLKRRYPDPAGWPGGEWPSSGSFVPPVFEIVVGAILTQNTRWRNVELALQRMRQRRLVSAAALESCALPRLEEAVRPSGFFRQKAKRLQTISRFILEFPGDFYRQVSRPQLLALEGVGPETADSILLYACGRPYFVADAYTRRILSRYGLLGGRASYQETRLFCTSRLPGSAPLFRYLHALLVEHAKTHCRRRPLCDACVLARGCRRRGV